MIRISEIGPIYLNITSTGGSTSAAIAIAQMIRTSNIPIATRGYGCVESSALLVLAAGTKGMRSIVEGTLISTHEHFLAFADVTSGKGTASQWQGHASRLQRSVERVYWLLEKCTQRKAAFWEEMMKDMPDKILTEEEALEYGLVDEIVAF